MTEIAKQGVREIENAKPKILLLTAVSSQRD
jgi:hypothetical protein